MRDDIETKFERLNEDEIPDSIGIPTWVRPGNGMMYNRWGLNADDPEHPYWYVWREYGVDPKRYNIENPLVDKYGSEKIKTYCPCCGYEFWV